MSQREDIVTVHRSIIDRQGRMSPAEWAMLLCLSVLWGGSFFFVGVAVHAVPPLTLVLLRVGLAALILNAVLIATGTRRPAGRRIWTALLMMGALNNVIPFCLFVWSQTQIASGLASILNATTPLFGVVVAHLFTADERMSVHTSAGVVAGLLGTAVMVGSSAMDGLGAGVLAQGACLAAALSYALAGVYGRRFKAVGLNPIATAAGQVTASTFLIAPVALALERPWTLPVPGWPVWGSVVALALLSTALGYVLYFRILAGAGAVNLMLVTFLIPISAILLGSTILGEAIEPRHLAGMALIGLGLAAIDGRVFRRSPRRTQSGASYLDRGRDI